MVFGNKNHLVGLDIGSAFVKVAELKMSKKGNSLEKFGVAQVAEGVVSEGRIMDMEGLAETIRNLFKSQKIKEKKVAISTGGHSVVIKTISTAKVPEKELHKTIRSEAEQYIPYDIDDVNIDYQVLGESEFSPDQMNVLLVAVKQDLVAEYIELIRMAGLTPSIIDVDTFALQNLYETLPENDPEQVTLLLDVGASKTSMNILKENNSLMMRDMMSGFNQIHEAVSERYEIDLEAAGDIILGRKAPPDDPGALVEIQQAISNAWCAEICEVVHTFESNANDMKLNKVVVSGGGGFIEGFAKSLASELAVPIAGINSFEGLIVDPKRFPDEMLEKAKLQSPIALGLAMRRVNDK
ncbi:MAG: pilus assembly protein PilM [Desulfobacterales bacterium]|nr:pilus assembly protein PilM [Desulfobacterales bacterium]